MPRKLSYDGSVGERIFGRTFSKTPNFRRLKEEVSEDDKLFFEMPLITETFYAEAHTFIESLCLSRGVTFIVNDYGTLLFCAKLKADGANVSIVAGRLVGYQYSSIPWIEEIIKGESAVMRRAFLGNYFDSEQKAEILREYGVSGIYCNYSEHATPEDDEAARESITRVRDMGFEIYINIVENILAVNPLADDADALCSTGGTLVDAKLADISVFDGMVTQKRILRNADFADVWVI